MSLATYGRVGGSLGQVSCIDILSRLSTAYQAEFVFLCNVSFCVEVDVKEASQWDNEPSFELCS